VELLLGLALRRYLEHSISMPNRGRREALRGVEKQTLDLLSEVFSSQQWSELLKGPLERAAARGKRGLAQKLVRAGAEIGNALHAAVWGSHGDIVSDLLKNGASIAAKDTNGCTPLHFAAKKGKTEMVQLLLLKGADKDALDNKEWTPLYTAVYHGRTATSLALLAGGASVSLRCGALKGSSVHMAAELGHVDILRATIEHGADVNAADANHCTALHGAASENKVGAIDMLVEAGANIEVRSLHGMKPLHSAAGQLSIDAMVALLRHGADVNAKSLNLLSPLMVASTKAGTRGAAEVVDLLLRSGADETIADEDGHVAADMMGRAVEEKHRLAGGGERVRELLANAPADRAWRRRGYIALCRAHPDRVQLRPEAAAGPRAGVGGGATSRLRSGAKLARLGAAGGSGGAATAGGTANRRGCGDWTDVLTRVLRLQEEGIFRAIVGYL